MAKVSIIVAAYNVEEYIREAMDSAVNQTMQDIEIIAVDDHSTDGTAEILQEYAARDSRVKVIVHEENKSPLVARYTGVMAASGKYVLFLDGDDYLIPNACECLFQEIVERQLDLLFFNSVVFGDKNNTPDEKVLSELKSIYSHAPSYIPQNGQDLLRLCFRKDPIIHWNLWGKMYSLSLLKSAYQFLNDEHIYMAEDLLITFSIFYYTHSCGHKDQSFYCYRVGNGISTTSSLPTLQKLEQIATEYQVYPLLCKWFSRCQRKKHKMSKSLSYVRAKTHADVLNYFLYRAAPEDCSAFLQAILKYCSLEEFIKDLFDYLRKETTLTAADVAMRLRDCVALSPQRKTIKTVASFYYRLYNGGVERVIALLASIWKQAGYRVIIITEEDSTSLDYSLPKDVRRISLSSLKSERNEQRLQLWKHLVQEYQVDAVVYHAWVNENRFLDALAIKSQGIPFILHTHSLATFSFQYPDYSTKICQEATDALSDVVITLSEQDQAWWNALGFRSIYTFNPFTFLPQAVMPSTLQNHNGVWIGRLSPEKQYFDAFNIAKLVRQKIPDFKLYVIGKAENNTIFQNIQQYVVEHNMSSYILLDGYHSDLASIFHKVSVMLFTSETEGAPMSIMEGKTFGVPLVTYELANVSAIRAGQGMFIVRQRDMRTAADRVIRLLEDDDLRHKMGAEARQSAEEIANFDFAEHWRKIFELSLEPRQPHKPLYQLPPMDAALRTAMRLVAQGAKKRSSFPVPVADPSKVELNETIQQLAYENASYAKMVEEIKDSTSYKIGLILTSIPRKIKKFLRHH